jgi:hypothetical protein
MPDNENFFRLTEINAEPEKELRQPGIIKRVSPDQANAEASIRLNFERKSNVIAISEEQQEKHDSPITSTEAGR